MSRAAPGLPRVIASSVVRSAHQGQSHGGVYLIDLERGTSHQVIDWNDPDISWEGRGQDRGLRGIAFHDGNIVMAASDEILLFDRKFRRLASWRNRFLKHAHEITAHEGRIYITSTGLDSILVLDPAAGRFTEGHCIRLVAEEGLVHAPFDPESETGPDPFDSVHLNSIHLADGTMYIAGRKLQLLLSANAEGIKPWARLPMWSHNARPFRDGVLLNDTGSDRVLYADRNANLIEAFPVPAFPEDQLLMNDLPEDHARAGFARGLCVAPDGTLIAGSSPATVSAYRFGDPAPIRSVNLTRDVRNSIHGLALWPFPDWPE